MQNWLRQTFYPNEYFKTVYEYYAAHGVAYICTYYNLDYELSKMDKTEMGGGAYERVGVLSGAVWKKITYLPTYNLTATTPRWSADEKGMTKSDQTAEFNFPTIYQIQPTTFDFVLFEMPVLNNPAGAGSASVYHVVNFEKSTDSDISFWKIPLKISHITKDKIEKQVANTYTFVDYEKKIYQSDDASFLMNLLMDLDENLLNKYYSNNSGLYLGV